MNHQQHHQSMLRSWLQNPSTHLSAATPPCSAMIPRYLLKQTSPDLIFALHSHKLNVAPFPDFSFNIYYCLVESDHSATSRVCCVDVIIFPSNKISFIFSLLVKQTTKPLHLYVWNTHTQTVPIQTPERLFNKQKRDKPIHQIWIFIIKHIHAFKLCINSPFHTKTFHKISLSRLKRILILNAILLLLYLPRNSSVCDMR